MNPVASKRPLMGRLGRRGCVGGQGFLIVGILQGSNTPGGNLIYAISAYLAADGLKSEKGDLGILFSQVDQ